MKYTLYIIAIVVLFAACRNKEVAQNEKEHDTAAVSEKDKLITFQRDSSVDFFETERVGQADISYELKAPGKVAALVLSPGSKTSQNIILFNDPEISNAYAQWTQLQIGIARIKNVEIKRKELELKRMEEMQEYGGATGQELLNAKTELAIEKNNLIYKKAALNEQEVRLKTAGFGSKMLQTAQVGTAYLISKIPEVQIKNLQKGQRCKVILNAFPKDTIKGKIDGVADQIDNQTRMASLRVRIENKNSKFKTGMYAEVSFEAQQNEVINISKEALVTVQGRHYVFIKKSPLEIERRQLETGQGTGERIAVYSGLKAGEKVVVRGAMQLKGLSFGY